MIARCALLTLLAGGAGISYGQETPPAAETAAPATARTEDDANSVVIRWPDGKPGEKEEGPRFSARFTPDALQALVETRADLLPLPMQLGPEQAAIREALGRIDMGALVTEINDYLNETFGDRFRPSRDLILAPVPPDKQVTVDLSDLGLDPYRGPVEEVIGFIVNDMTQAEYLNAALRVMTTARKLVDKADPVHDRKHADHYRMLAELAAAEIRQAREAEIAAETEREAIRDRVGGLLGNYNAETDTFEGSPKWMKESRRFSYIVDEETGQFIDRLQPTVDRINRQMELAGFAPPSPLDKPGIHFDPDLRDVEIVLPEKTMEAFLAQTDELEQRMAEKLIISIEAVRLTDRDIVDGAVAARINAQVQGVHDPEYFNTDGVIRQLGINSLLAVANQQLQVATLAGVAAGSYPDGVSPISIPAPELPPLQTSTTATTIGSTFSVGADDIFFDGREQTYGFSYIGPDGIEHTLGIDVVDSLREFWGRIERNLIVHKIKKVAKPTMFTVPVGPDTKTYEGIAALISQQDQTLLVSSGNAVERTDATAGTWLVIQDFEIAPIPGSSTAMTEEEVQAIHDRVLLTMWLRDPLTPVEFKRELLRSTTLEELHALVSGRLEEKQEAPIRDSRTARSYGTVYEERYKEELEQATVEKKEKNSVISLTFYSSQGNIVQTPGTTQLGSENDLTAFTTELRPNLVTPISSFFNKSLESARGTSPLTGVRKGESSNEEKVMTHLVIRARFPTDERERDDRNEGRYLGYFQLPLEVQPASVVDLPFLSSSEHPLERLATLRVGLMFDALQANKVRKALNLLDPNVLEGTVTPEAWQTATTRMMLNRKIISDSPARDIPLGPRYSRRFIVEVRSLLEYDPDFFDDPNAALRNTYQWNDADRIMVALNNSPGRFALSRLIDILDDLGGQIVPDEYADDYLARSPASLFGHKLEPLSERELTQVRRDAANHFLRLNEAYGDAFFEAASLVLGLGTYRAEKVKPLLAGPLRGYRDLVVFDAGAGAMTDAEQFEHAHEQFIVLKAGGYKGALFEPSLETIEDMDDESEPFVIRGRDVLERSF